MRTTYFLGLGFIAVLSLSHVANAATGQNVKGLDNVAVTITQSQSSPVISQNAVLQLDTDTKLKLKSAGITLTSSPEATKAVFDINIQSIKEITNEWVMVQILVVEDVNTTGRKAAQKTSAVTYFDQAFFKMSMSMADKKVYDVALNDLVTKFVAKYLDQNSK